MSVELERIGWENGTLVSPAKVLVDGQYIDVIPEQYSGNTPLSAENLQEMEDNTENAINEGIIESNTYSTEETIIGKWIDGKPIYRKVVNTGTLPNTQSKTVAHNIENFKRIIRLYGNAYDSIAGTIYPLPITNSEGVQYQVALRVSTTNITIATGINRSNFTESYVVLEYTKTTD